MLKAARIGEFLHRHKESVSIEPDHEYSLVTVKMHHKGVVLREKKKGVLLGSNMYRIKKGQFILSGIDARQGAFGIVPDELDGAIITNDFWCFDVDERIVKRDFFYWLTSTPLFLDACQKSSKGETQRIRLQKELFYAFEFRFPPINEQVSFLKRIRIYDDQLTSLDDEQDKQAGYLKALRQSILQEAIEGKLTAAWRKKHPYKKGDPERDGAALLERIREEKNKLVAEGKIKKGKVLAPIEAGEEPFEIPEGWVWCRLGEICSKIGSGSTPRGGKYSDSGIPFFRSQNIYDGGIELDDIKYINDRQHQAMEGTSVNSNDLLLNITGGSLGRCASIPASLAAGNVSQHVCIIRPVLILQGALHIVVRSPYFQKSIFASTTGAGREGLPKYNLELFYAPLPPLAEQTAIVERVEALLAHVDELENEVASRKKLTGELMREVLREAFEGEGTV